MKEAILNHFFIMVIILTLFNCSKTNKETVVESYHGIEISDSYRELENFEDPKILEWLKEEKKIAQNKLQQIPGQDRLKKLKDKYGSTSNIIFKKINVTKNNVLFYLKRLASDNFFKLYYREDMNSKEIELFDPKDYQLESKKNYIINYIKPSWDGKKVLIALSHSGSEISTIIVQEVYNKKILQETITNVKPKIGGVFWLPDNSGFVYSKITEKESTTENINLNTKVMIHKLGFDEKNDVDFFSKSSATDLDIKSEDFPIIYIDYPEDKYIIGTVANSTPYFDAYYSNVEGFYKKKQNWKPLFKRNQQVYMYYQNGDEIIYLTSKNASNFKICKTSILSPDFENPQVIVAEKNDEVIKNFLITKEGIFYTTFKNGVSAKLYHKANGIEKEISLPIQAGRIRIESSGKKSDHLYVEIQSWITPPIRYRYSFDNKMFNQENLNHNKGNSFQKDLIIEELLVTAKDGKQIPLSLVYRKDLKKDGDNSILMRAYGAYGISMPPIYSLDYLIPALEGGIYAVAHVRGGGEKGDSWYKGGFKETKSNSWNDFISCTEFLIEKGYTSKEKTAIWSGSAGGIVIGRAITERPDLYAAAIVDFGMLNAIRFEKSVNGSDISKEFGSVKDPKEFKSLLEMDAFHHIKKDKTYPATLITMGLNDTRVSPWQSAKFAKKLMDLNSSNKPILLNTYFDSGHGMGDSKSTKTEKKISALSFALWQTGHPDYQLKE